MRRFAFLVMLALLTTMLLATGTSTPASAATTTPNHPATPFSFQNAGPTDNDVTVGVGSLTYLSVVAEGRLVLKPVGNSTINFAGTFTDNYAGAKVYKAGLTTDNLTFATYTINTPDGKFVITNTQSGTTSTLPTKFGPNSHANFSIGGPHTQATATMNVSLAPNSLGYMPPTTGTFTITYDSAYYIIPNNPKIGSISRFTYIANGKTVISPLTSPGTFREIQQNVVSGFIQTIFKYGGINFGITAYQVGTTANAYMQADAVGGKGIDTTTLTFTATAPTGQVAKASATVQNIQNPNRGTSATPMFLNFQPQDDDLAIIVADASTAPNYRTIVAEGRFTLVAKGTAFVGTFTDNTGGGKVYAASGVTTAQGVKSITINTHQGKFVFNQTQMSNTVIYPKKFGPTAVVSTFEIVHASYTATLQSVYIADDSYNFKPTSVGTMTIVYDAQGFIMPFNKKTSSNSNFSFAMNNKSYSVPLSASGEFTPLGFGVGMLQTQLKIGGTLYAINAKETGSGKFDGWAYAGGGASGALITFQTF